MTEDEGLNVNQGGAYAVSRTAQHVPNVKWSSGGRDQQPALNDDLLERVLSPANLHTAWKQVRRNKGAPGVDGVSIEDYPQWAKQHWAAARRALERGYYMPQPVRRVETPKPTGGVRLLLTIRFPAIDGVECIRQSRGKRSITVRPSGAQPSRHGG